MRATIQGFRKNLHEPWWLIAGFPPYLQSARDEGVLAKTVLMPYGAIEGEPSFPRTNLPLDPVRKVVDLLAEYPGVSGIMGNNQTPLLQLPRTHHVLASAWRYEYRKKSDLEVLQDLAEQLYPGQAQLVADGYAALRGTDADKINDLASRLDSIANSDAVKPGLLGRCVFPDPLQVMRDLITQLQIRARERALISIAFGNTKQECAQAVESYLDSLLAWNRKTGWEKLVKIGMWRGAIYPQGDKELMHAMSGLKLTIAGGSQPATYNQIAAFFDPIARSLSEKYGSHAAMTACVEPMKLAVMQAS